jgi:acyl-CoA synthetase (AMP-forming)/AMP-acid ligase II
MNLVPTMLARIMTADDADLQVPSLRTLAYGGAAMPLPVIERALRSWPHVDFVNAYGLTETSSTVAVLGPDDHRTAIASDDPVVRARLSCAGQVVPSIELQIRDEDGTVLGAGQQGRIWVRGEHIEAVGATASGDSLREHVRSCLRGSKTPDRILIWDELPRAETGKLVRREAVARITRNEPATV